MEIKDRKLNPDQIDDLLRISQSDMYKSLRQELENILFAQRQDIHRIKINIEKPLEVTLLKAEIEGAEKYFTSIMANLDSYKRQDSL